jgi:CRP-like cAMP-binding protein
VAFLSLLRTGGLKDELPQAVVDNLEKDFLWECLTENPLFQRLLGHRKTAGKADPPSKHADACGARAEALLSAFEVRHFRPSDTIIRQGDEGDLFYVIDSGMCEVTASSGAGPTKAAKRLCTLGPGQSFGEHALLYKMPRTGDAARQSDRRVVTSTPQPPWWPARTARASC